MILTTLGESQNVARDGLFSAMDERIAGVLSNRIIRRSSHEP